jgi:Plasmid pRiA4b ORF-3-like protein
MEPHNASDSNRLAFRQLLGVLDEAVQSFLPLGHNPPVHTGQGVGHRPPGWNDSKFFWSDFPKVFAEDWCIACKAITTCLAECRFCHSSYCSKFFDSLVATIPFRFLDLRSDITYIAEHCKKQDLHRHACSFNFIVEVSLMKVKYPTITRRLSVPSTSTFEELHHALQIAFSWRPTDDYEFGIGKTLVTSADRIAMKGEERSIFSAVKNGKTTYIVEEMKHTYRDRKILGYQSDVRSELVHHVKIKTRDRPPFGGGPDISCLWGYGHAFAEGFDLREWAELKEAYDVERPNR